MGLQVGVGYSEELDETADAVEEAFSKAVAAFGAEKPKAALVFASVDYDQVALIEALREKLGALPMIGCTTDGEITVEGLHIDSLSIMLLGGQNINFRAAVVTEVNHPEVEARTQAVAEGLQQAMGSHGKLALTFPDCSGTGSFQPFLRGLKQAFGRSFPMFGGAPADRARLKGQTWQYCNGELYSQSAPILLVDGEIDLVHGLSSGVKPFGQPARCTRAQGNLLLEIEHKPAIEHHRAWLGSDHVNAATIAQFPYITHDREVEGREYFVTQPIFTWVPENGAIFSIFPIDEGAQVRLGRCTRENILAGATQAAHQVKEQLGSRSPKALFVFSCSGRKQILGVDTPMELAQIREELGTTIPTIGFYCYGELGPLGHKDDDLKECQVHGYTVSMMALT